MTRSLRYKFLIPLLLAALLLLLVTGWLSYRAMAQELRQQLVQHGEFIRSILSETAQVVDSYDEMRFALESVTLETSHIYGVTLMTRDPKVIWASSFHPGPDQDLAAQAMLATMKLATEQSLFGRFIAPDGDLVMLAPVERVDRVNPVPVDVAQLTVPAGLEPQWVQSLPADAFRGIFYLRFDWESARAGAEGRMLQQAALTAAGSLMLLLFALWLLYRLVLSPAKRIGEIAARQRSGDRSARLGTLGSEELDQLGAALNSMLEAQEQSDRRFRERYELLPDPAWVIDGNRFVECNQAAVDVLGYDSKEQLLNVHPAMLSPVRQSDGEDSVQKADRMIRLAQEQGMHRFEWLYQRADDSTFYAEVTLSRVVMDGRPVIYCVWRDISEQKAARQALMEKETAEAAARAKGTFLANMSHEIRTPLSAVLGLARIGAHSTSPERMRELFAEIDQSGEHLLHVVNDILDFSKMEAGKLVLDEAPLRLADEVNAVLAFVSKTAADKGLSLDTHLSAELPEWVRGDALRLRQILLNLLSNAVKFTDQGGVSISVLPCEEGIAISISDTGIGMDQPQLERLFHPFEQADMSISRRYGGTGLGMTICASLIRAMGGDILVRSALEAGTTFKLTLPLVEVDCPDCVRETHDAAHGPGLSGLRVLAAEDVDINRLILEELLITEGAEVSFAENGREAVEALHARGGEAFDVVLMDIQMPLMDGYEATRRIVAMAPGLPVIGLTAHAMADAREQSHEAGMVDHVTKPIDRDALVKSIRCHVRFAAPESGIQGPG